MCLLTTAATIGDKMVWKRTEKEHPEFSESLTAKKEKKLVIGGAHCDCETTSKIW